MTRILIDMDNVLADFSTSINHHVVSLGGRAITPDQHTNFELEGIYPDHAADLRHAIRQPGFYRDLDPIEGAIEGVATLQNAGLDVYVCTAPVRSPYCAGEKLDWIVRLFDNHLAGRTVITKDKALVRGDVLIDDKPEVTGADTPSWTHLVFDQPYNRHVNGPRLTSWTAPDLLDQVLAAA